MPELAKFLSANPKQVVFVAHRDLPETLALTKASHLNNLETSLSELKTRSLQPFKLAGSIQSELSDEELEQGLADLRKDAVRRSMEELRGSEMNHLLTFTEDRLSLALNVSGDILFETTRLTDYSNDSLLAEIRRVAVELQSLSLTKTAFRAHGRVSPTTILRRFGTWDKALEAAGVGQLYKGPPPAIKSSVLGRKLGSEELIRELQRVAATLGQNAISQEQFEAHSPIGRSTVRSRFGSWRQALKAAGLENVNHGRRYTDHECFENLLSVWTKHRRPPKCEEMNKPPSVVGAKAYLGRWGKWNAAVQAFVEQLKAVQVPENQPAVGVREAPTVREPSNTRPEDRRQPPLGLRYNVLLRDGFKCVLCGSSPATEASCRLEIDHLEPFSKGGKTTIDNLRTLCERCNLGKSNKFERIPSTAQPTREPQ